MRPQQPPVNIDADPGADGSEDLAEGRDMIDDEAIEQFGRELDDLSEAEVATQAIEEDEAADATASSAPSAPF